MKNGCHLFLVFTISHLHANLLAAAMVLRLPIFPGEDSGRSSFVFRGIMLRPPHWGFASRRGQCALLHVIYTIRLCAAVVHKQCNTWVQYNVAQHNLLSRRWCFMSYVYISWVGFHCVPFCCITHDSLLLGTSQREQTWKQFISANTTQLILMILIAEEYSLENTKWISRST